MTAGVVDVQRADGLRRRPRTVDATAVAGLVHRGETVVAGHGGGWPRLLVQALVAEAQHPFFVMHNRVEEALPYFGARHVRHVGLMASRSTRAAINAGAADYVPNCYGDTPALFRDGVLPCDVVLVHVTPPDAAGWHSLGTCSAYLSAACTKARLVVAQVNERMPVTRGTRIHTSALDYVVPVDEPLYREEVPAAGQVVTAIARNVAGLIGDGDVLQIGIGKLGNAILGELSGRTGLRLWTETFGDAALDLLRDGTLRGSEEMPAITATFVTGSPALYEALHGETRVQVLPVDRTNHPGRLAGIPHLVAVNSAIEVDLTGQVNAETRGGQVYSGAGGHLDFAIGAQLSPGGRYVCALPATAGDASRIVPTLSTAAAVTVPRALAGYVVTEFGVANLRGRSMRERAEALIAVAHPDHRELLRKSLDRQVGVS
ncbi:MAG: 4-hydroxybutyrate CoA-transferase [Streptosporangiales bacterium]|nr:4-hydroxybutyrate CoA-transferase [Streptosporangiales bacterium]